MRQSVVSLFIQTYMDKYDLHFLLLLMIREKRRKTTTVNFVIIKDIRPLVLSIVWVVLKCYTPRDVKGVVRVD